MKSVQVLMDLLDRRVEFVPLVPVPANELILAEALLTASLFSERVLALAESAEEDWRQAEILAAAESS